MHGPSARRRWQMGLQEDGGNAYLPGWPETPRAYNKVFFAVKKKLLQMRAPLPHSELLFSIEVTG